jgi:hypothetical protein
MHRPSGVVPDRFKGGQDLACERETRELVKSLSSLDVSYVAFLLISNRKL